MSFNESWLVSYRKSTAKIECTNENPSLTKNLQKLEFGTVEEWKKKLFKFHEKL